MQTPNYTTTKELDYKLGSERKRYYKPDQDIRHDPFVIQAEDYIGPAPTFSKKTGFGMVIDSSEKKLGANLAAAAAFSSVFSLVYSRMEHAFQREYPKTLSQVTIWRKYAKKAMCRPFMVPFSFLGILSLGRYYVEQQNNGRMDTIMTGREVFVTAAAASMIPGYFSKNAKVMIPTGFLLALAMGDYQNELVTSNFRLFDMMEKRKKADVPFYSEVPDHMKKMTPISSTNYRFGPINRTMGMDEGFEQGKHTGGVTYNSVGIRYADETITERLNRDQL